MGLTRSRKTIIGIVGVVVLLLAAGGIVSWQLLSSDDDDRAITVGTTDQVTSLDPAGAYDGGSWALMSNIYQSLMTVKPGANTPVPDAARTCRFDGDDLRTYTCELRSDLHFSSGRQITVEDVKFSFDRIHSVGAELGPSPLLKTLKRVETKGEDTIIFHLSSPDATFPLKISSGAGAIVDKDHYSRTKVREGRSADGSGPYRLASYQPGRTAKLEPNPNYKGAISDTGRPINVLYFKDSEGLTKAWKQHDLDVAARQLPPDYLSTVDSVGGDTKVVESRSTQNRYLVFNLKDGTPTAKKAVRQAAAAVVDRDAMARRVHQRTVEPLYSFIPQGLSGHTTAYYDAYPKPDRDAAKKLLDEAGISTPVRFNLDYPRSTTNGPEAKEVKRELEATGLFKVNVRQHEWNDFQKGYSAGKFDAYLISWLADYPDPDTFISPLLGKDSALYNGYQDSQVQDMIRQTQGEHERARAAKVFAEIEQHVVKDVPSVPLWQRKDYVLSDDSISGTQYLSDSSDNWRLWELDYI